MVFLPRIKLQRDFFSTGARFGGIAANFAAIISWTKFAAAGVTWTDTARLDMLRLSTLSGSDGGADELDSGCAEISRLFDEEEFCDFVGLWKETAAETSKNIC